MSSGRIPACLVLLCSVWLVAASRAAAPASSQPPSTAARAPAVPLPQHALLDSYCVTCHNQRLRTGGLALDTVDSTRPEAQAEIWERVIARLRARTMPPAAAPRPDAATYDALVRRLESDIDRAWAEKPTLGRTSAVHRLNRSEYNHAIRDLFALDIDVTSLLPGDETADGSFDNFAAVLTISTAHLERYLSVARQVTRLAVGLAPSSPAVQTFEIPLHVVQDERQSEDLPFGSRGGIAVRHHFPVDGEYVINVRLRRQYQDYVMGMGWPQQLDVRLDGRLLKRFTVGGAAPGRPAAASYAGDGEPGFAGAPEWERYMQLTADAGLEVRVPVPAGPHTVGVSFVRELWEPEGLPQPVQRGRVLTNDQIYMGHASVGSLQILGPFDFAQGKPLDVARRREGTPSRRAIFTCDPSREADEMPCATTILSRLARLAYRRPVTPSDTQTLLELSMDAPANAGACTGNLSCVYTHTLSWRSATQPLPMEHNPRAVFEKLFGDSGSTDAEARQARLRQHKSILDSVSDKLSRLKNELGPQDQGKLDEYTESVRDVERRIEKAEGQRDLDLPVLEQPQGVPPVFEDHLALMLDLQVLAFQSDLTRVISFMLAKEQSARPYPQIGVPEAHHPLSHHGDIPELVAHMSKINRYHAELFAGHVQKLSATADGDGSLLDHMTILYGSGISNSNRHAGDNLPLLLVGGGAGTLKGGRHLTYDKQPSMANLLVTLMDKLGVPVERLGGSTGPLPLDTLAGV